MFKRFGTYIAIVILLIILPVSLVSKLRNAAITLVRPLGRNLVKSNNLTLNTFRNLRQIPQLRSDNDNLEQQLIALQQKLINYQQLQTENETLRKQLGVTNLNLTYPKALAHVILHSNDPFDPLLTVDVGSAQGLKIGQPAIYEGTLVGKVSSVRANSALIRPIVSRSSIIQAWLTTSHDKGTITGDGHSAFLSNISQGVTVEKNSVIETSGLGQSLPQGIVVGQTGNILSKKSDSDQEFNLSLSHDPLTLNEVFIILSDTIQ